MQQLLEYGFTPQDINNFINVYNMIIINTPSVYKQAFKMGYDQNYLMQLANSYTRSGRIMTEYAGNIQPTAAKMQQLGYDYNQAQRMVYLYKLCSGQIILDSVPKIAKHFNIVMGCDPDTAKRKANEFVLRNGGVDTKEGLVSTLKKINKNQVKITMNDLAVSRVQSVPRFAVVSNIDSRFYQKYISKIKREHFDSYSIWNSKNYSNEKALYHVVDVTGQNIKVKTTRKPKIAFGQASKLDGMLNILGTTNEEGNSYEKLHEAKFNLGSGIETYSKDKYVIVEFNKNFCKLCNRFVIVATIRIPQFHLGKYEIVCFEGTKIYVFATIMSPTKEEVGYNMGNQRIYDYGIFPQDIKPKLTEVAKKLYANFRGEHVEYEAPNTQYQVVPVNKNTQETEEDGIEY